MKALIPSLVLVATMLLSPGPLAVGQTDPAMNLDSFSPPYPAQESGVVRPTGDYRIAHLSLTNGWRAGGDDEWSPIQLVIGFRDGRATTVWIATDTRTHFRDRETTLEIRRGRLTGEAVAGLHAQAGPLIRYRFDATVDEKGRITGTVETHFDRASTTSDVSGTIRDRAALRAANALAPDKAWPNYFGANGGFSGTPSNAPLLSDLSDARLVWKSEDAFGTGWGNGPDSRYGPFRPMELNNNSGTATPIVADGKVFHYYFVPTGDERQFGFLEEGGGYAVRWITGSSQFAWQPRWRERFGNRPFTEKTFGHMAARADEVIICLDAATGELLWKRTYAAAGRNIQTHKWRGLNPTPAFRDGVLVVETYIGSVYVLDANTGDELWSRVQQQEDPAASRWPGPRHATITIAGDIVALNRGNRTIGVNLRSTGG